MAEDLQADFILWICFSEFLPARAATFPFANLFRWLWLAPIPRKWDNNRPTISVARLIRITNFAPIGGVQGGFETRLNLKFNSSIKINKYYLVFVRFRTVIAVQLSMTLLLGLGVIVLVLLFDVAFPECFRSQLQIFFRCIISFCVYNVNEGHSTKDGFSWKSLKFRFNVICLILIIIKSTYRFVGHFLFLSRFFWKLLI